MQAGNSLAREISRGSLGVATQVAGDFSGHQKAAVAMVSATGSATSVGATGRKSTGVADFNGDRKPDLTVVNGTARGRALR